MSGEGWLTGTRRWLREGGKLREVRIGLALGGGFARGVSHIGVLKVFERERIPLHCISGVSSGAIVAAAFASGASTAEIEKVAHAMRFSDVARWTLSLHGLMHSDPMKEFLHKALKVYEFEKMRIPLAVVATDLHSGTAAVFRDKGDVVMPIRATCAYPGLFAPVRYMNHSLVDGGIVMDVPAEPLRKMGATHVVSVALEAPTDSVDPDNMLSVVTRCFQIMNSRCESQWRRVSNLVITPEVRDVGWRSFDSADAMIEAGERAAESAMVHIRRWLSESPKTTEHPAGAVAPASSPSLPEE